MRAWFDFKDRKTLGAEATFSACNNEFLFGDNLVFDIKKMGFTSYEHGLVWEPKKDLNVALKHKANTNNGRFAIGKAWLMLHQRVKEGHVLGAEFLYNHIINSTSARFGLSH